MVLGHAAGRFKHHHAAKAMAQTQTAAAAASKASSFTRPPGDPGERGGHPLDKHDQRTCQG